MDDDVLRFFSRSTHCKPDVMKQILNDIGTVCLAMKLSCRVSTWGATQQVKLCIYGGLPVVMSIDSNDFSNDSSKAVQTCRYTLPIQIWLTHQYPIDPPLIFLFGTEPGCKIASNHKYVDATGRCHTPELAAWQPASSSLSTTLEKLVRELEEEGVFPLCIDPEVVECSAMANSASHSRISRKNEDDDNVAVSENDQCVICFNAKDTVLVPCGHYSLCGACATNVSHCPLCRETVKFRQHIFH
ncbi:hypothetical protein DQ04_08731020 [Trypanosoma grayi]|uniref:hypothetical protein n=1 Tax=Trypanosoma grayi TaxID=71804 RepID=UPI0004F48B75|nr:hypothetical protein DQ04_08731020 [Trypanosoma grayi]KEG07823.1 hypothetical protein DQ04_08731020 [Trypanosoma grayi]